MGQPLEEYGITPAKLQVLSAAIATFYNVKAAPPPAVGSRSANNATVPQILRQMRVDFTIPDNLVKGMDKASPTFVKEYLSARNIINTGGRGSGAATPPTDSKVNNKLRGYLLRSLFYVNQNIPE